MDPLIFDIETGPESAEALARVEPEFKAPANYKDPEKIEAKKQEAREEWQAKAALYAETGRVLVIGIGDGDDIDVIDEPTEAETIQAFWDMACPRGAWRPLIGFNSNRFDLPYLVRRSFLHGIKVPSGLIKGRYLGHQCIDLMEIWRVGDYQASISLDRLARFLGCGEKNGDGAKFADLYDSDREKALEYARNDIKMTRACAERLGVIAPTVPSNQQELDY